MSAASLQQRWKDLDPMLRAVLTCVTLLTLLSASIAAGYARAAEVLSAPRRVMAVEGRVGALEVRMEISEVQTRLLQEVAEDLRVLGRENRHGINQSRNGINYLTCLARVDRENLPERLCQELAPLLSPLPEIRR